MKFRHLVPAGFVLLLALTAWLVYSRISPAFSVEDIVMEKPSAILIIDPGHGGYDPGAIAEDGTQEKDLSLLLAGKIGQKLHQLRPDVQILYTRNGDQVPWPSEESQDLAWRTTMDGDAFLSIHFNMAENPAAHGSFGFVRSEDMFSQQVLDQINVNLEKTPFTGLSWKTTNNQPLFVVDRQEIPAVLYEAGYLSNVQERNKLKNLRYLDGMAEAIAQAYADALPGRENPG